MSAARERRCVVAPVADHCDAFGRGQASDRLGFRLRRDFRERFVDRGVFLELPRSSRRVPSEHDDATPVRCQILNNRLPAVPHLVADDEHPPDGPAPANVRRDATRLASVRADRVERLGHAPRIALEQRAVTDDDLVAVDLPRNTPCP